MKSGTDSEIKNLKKTHNRITKKYNLSNVFSNLIIPPKVQKKVGIIIGD